MSTDWNQVAHEWQQFQPHPLEPSLSIGEFAIAVKLATMARFGGHASPHEAGLFWPQFKATGMSPQEFEHALDRLAPLSFVYHGRPPTMQEIVQLKDKQPHEVRKYFGDLPHRQMPEMSAGEVVKALRAAEPHAREHVDRPPVLHEARYLHFSGESPRDYYQRIATPDQGGEPTIPPDNGVSVTQRGNSTGRRLAPFGGPQADQRTPNR